MRIQHFKSLNKRTCSSILYFLSTPSENRLCFEINYSRLHISKTNYCLIHYRKLVRSCQWRKDHNKKNVCPFAEALAVWFIPVTSRSLTKYRQRKPYNKMSLNSEKIVKLIFEARNKICPFTEDLRKILTDFIMVKWILKSILLLCTLYYLCSMKGLRVLLDYWYHVENERIYSANVAILFNKLIILAIFQIPFWNKKICFLSLVILSAIILWLYICPIVLKFVVKHSFVHYYFQINFALVIMVAKFLNVIVNIFQTNVCG